MSIAVILCLPGYVCSNFVFWVLGADHLFQFDRWRGIVHPGAAFELVRNLDDEIFVYELMWY